MNIEVQLPNPEQEKLAEQLTSLSFSQLRSIYVPTPDAREQAAADAGTFSRLVAVDDRDTVLGTLLYRIEGDRLHFRALAVHPDQRRRGIARALLESLAHQAAKAGVRALSLFAVVETGNVPIFKRLGFRVLPQSPDGLSQLATGGGHPTLAYMERELSGRGGET